MEIVKKFGIKIYHLIRNLDLTMIDFYDTYIDYEEDPKKVNWVLPEILYPKNDNGTNTNFNVASLTEEKIYNTLKNVAITDKKEVREKLLQISRMKFGEDQVIGYCFRISGTDSKRMNFDQIENKIKPDTKHLFLYDIINLNFMRTKIVDQKIVKSGQANEKEIRRSNKQIMLKNSITKSDHHTHISKKRHKSVEDSVDSVEELQTKLLIKEKVQELNSKTSGEVKEFIVSLMNYGDGIVFYRRNIETKQAQEFYFNNMSLIRQNVEDFLKRISQKNKQTENKTEKAEANSYIDADSIDFSVDQNSNLSNFFSDKSIVILKYLSIVFFLALTAIICFEFSITFSKVSDSSSKITYVNNAYQILNGILLSKYYLTEILLIERSSNYTFLEGHNSSEYRNLCFQQLEYTFSNISNYYNSFINTTYTFGSEFEAQFYNSYVTLNILQNNVSTTVPQAMSVSNSISDVSIK
jgi:hypothetical protein